MPKHKKVNNSNRNSTRTTTPNPFYRLFGAIQHNINRTTMPGTGSISRMAQRKNR